MQPKNIYIIREVRTAVDTDKNEEIFKKEVLWKGENIHAL